MKSGLFEFKGIVYQRYEDRTYGFGTGVRKVGELPNYSIKNVTEEIIPTHLRHLNKRQLRARILELEKILNG